MNEYSDIIHAVLEGVPDRVLMLQSDCHELKIPMSQDQSSIITFRRTPSQMLSGGRECVIFMRELAQ
jgi:hypothetical protein